MNRSLTILVFLLATSLLSAADKIYSIQGSLGETVDSYSKALRTELKMKTFPRIVMWIATIPELGRVNLRSPKVDASIGFIQVLFSDKSVATWQIAFERFGLSTDVERTQEETKKGITTTTITLKPLNGKTWKAYFYSKNPDGGDCAVLELSE